MNFIKKLFGFKQRQTSEQINLVDKNAAMDMTLDSISKDVIDYHINSFAKDDVKYELSNELSNFDYFYLCFGQYISIDPSERDPLFEEAARLIVINQQGSTSLIQRKFSIGYGRAGRLMDQLEAAGVVGPAEVGKARQVLILDEFTLEQKLDAFGHENYNNNLNINFEKDIRIKYADLINSKKLSLKDAFYNEKMAYENSILEAEKEQIRKDLLEKERVRNLRKQVKKELQETMQINSTRKRESIPQDIQDKVWLRDGGKCVLCGSQENLEFDHIIPFSKGGANTYRNLQLLCENCNRRKSNKIG